MQYAEAPQEFNRQLRPWVFLAGGITNCPDWQQTVRSLLEPHYKATLLNPRRRNFPIGDPAAAQEQIAWEHRALWACNVFSMWFCNAESDQPICMFELGTHATRWKLGRRPDVVIGVQPGYRREQDVLIQMGLLGMSTGSISTTLPEHAAAILASVESYSGEP